MYFEPIRKAYEIFGLVLQGLQNSTFVPINSILLG